MSKTISKDDLAKLQNLSKQEQNLHTRIIQNKYNQVLQEKEEKSINEAVLLANQERQNANQIIEAKYGKVAQLNIETGEYLNVGDEQNTTDQLTSQQIPE